MTSWRSNHPIRGLYPPKYPPKHPPKPPSKRLYDLPMTRYSTSIFFLDHDVICGSPLNIQIDALKIILAVLSFSINFQTRFSLPHFFIQIFPLNQHLFKLLFSLEFCFKTKLWLFNFSR
jgi:hypothetical protein